jgi:hypothetical protein
MVIHSFGWTVTVGSLGGLGAVELTPVRGFVVIAGFPNRRALCACVREIAGAYRVEAVGVPQVRNTRKPVGWFARSGLCWAESKRPPPEVRTDLCERPQDVGVH